MNIWFTADTHYSHNNVIKYCNRPFANSHEMNRVLTENWNSVVRKNDWVYHLGDVGFGSTDKMCTILDKLNGKKFLIRGNHDKPIKGKAIKYFEWIKNLHDLTIQHKGETYKITLCHYAMRTWKSSCHGTWMLYGHSHGQLPDDPKLLSIDVGVDCHNFTPISLEQITEIMNKKIGCRTMDCVR